jgi:predicted ATPase/class 3 adenylate cyclase
MDHPSGTITFLFTDIEGSTRLWEEHPPAMRQALARHNALVAQAIAKSDGYVFKTMGDAFCAAFAKAEDAVAAAVAAQSCLQAERWPDGTPIRVRIALHTGAADLDREAGDYAGPTVNRVARLLATGYGGQVLLSGVSRDLCRDSLPSGCTLKPLGEHRLKDLGRPELVFQLCHPDLSPEFPPLRSLDSPDLPNNLPRQVTSFIGREKELKEVGALIKKSRLVTFTGSGGCGKTRLALQAAADLLDGSGNGVWLVELASLSDPDLVPPTIAMALSVKEEAGRTMTQSLTDHLKSKHLFLVLDNCEHLLDACARLSDTLVRSCPRVHILATSREGLGIAGETVYQVPSLSSPDPRRSQTPEGLSQYEAVRLFIERAEQVSPAFRVTSENAPALASVCHRLDGIPLAIELAAARMRIMTVEEVNQKLNQRFRLLTGGSRTALPRQQTLRSLLDWSYDLLSVAEKALLRRLSVFSAGWTLDAAERVCSDEVVEEWELLDLLTSLADKSLMVADERDGRTRYRLLETVAQYSRDRLIESGEGETWRDRHLAHFLDFAEEAAPHLRGADPQVWMERLESEHDNLRAALEWSGTSERAEGLLRFCDALWWFWCTRGYLSEAREQLERSLSAPGAEARTSLRIRVLNASGYVGELQGDPARSQECFEESLAISRELGDEVEAAYALNGLGWAACHHLGDLDTARERFEGMLAIFHQLEDKRGIANSLHNLGWVARYRGDWDAARALLEEGLAIHREVGNMYLIGWSLCGLGELALEERDCRAACECFQESLRTFRQIGERIGIASSLERLAVTAEAQEQNTRSARLLGSAERLREDMGASLLPPDQPTHDRSSAAVRAALGEKAFAATLTEGRSMTLEQAIELALGDVGS